MSANSIVKLKNEVLLINETDFSKFFVGNNQTAGVRARKELRKLKKRVEEMIVETTNQTRAIKKARKAGKGKA